MKRGFLFGVGTFLGFAGLTGLSVDRPILESVLLAGIGVPLCLVTLSAASRAPPNRSRLHAVVGWLFGFFVIDAVSPLAS